VNSRAPHCWLLLMGRLMGRMPFGCMGRMTAVSACTLNQRSNPLLPTCHLHELCVEAPKEGPEGAVRGGGLFLEQHAWTPHGPLHSRAPCLCLCQLPELPLPLHGPSAERPASQRDRGLKNRVRGSQPGHAGSSFLKPPSKPLKIINLSLRI